jgi:hypothetical protein
MIQGASSQGIVVEIHARIAIDLQVDQAGSLHEPAVNGGRTNVKAGSRGVSLPALLPAESGQSA